jgi:Tfp pilus assembly protein FimT
VFRRNALFFHRKLRQYPERINAAYNAAITAAVNEVAQPVQVSVRQRLQKARSKAIAMNGSLAASDCSVDASRTHAAILFQALENYGEAMELNRR